MIEVVKIIGIIDAALLGLLLMVGMGYMLYVVIITLFGGKK